MNSKCGALSFALSFTLALLNCGGSTEHIESESPAISPADSASGTTRKQAPSAPDHESTTQEGESNEQVDMLRAITQATSVPVEPAAAPNSASTEATPGSTSSKLSRVELRFLDASIPPEYHRSYTIWVEQGKVNVEVDVYGEVIASDHAKLSDGSWSKLNNSVLPTQLEDKDSEAVGGSMTTLRLWLDEATPREWSWSAHTPDGEALKAAEALAARITALVPNLQALRDTEYTP